MSAPAARFDAFGVAVDAVDLATAVSAVLAAARRESRSYVCLVGAHGIVEARRNCPLADAFKQAILVLPDGMPTVWIGRSQGVETVDRVFGPDLMIEVFKRSQDSGERHFLFGGRPGVADDLAQSLTFKCPGSRIVGIYTPPFRELTEPEELDLANRLDECKPDIVWVGISTPKQELFMSKYCGRFNARVMVGVGAAFDYHTGRLQDSPHWVKRAGLQWLHRLLQEPRRLLWRYFRTNSIFVFLALLALARRFAPASSPSKSMPNRSLSE